MTATAAIPVSPAAILTGAEGSALLLSAATAFIVAILCLPPGVALAWLLARREFPGKTLLDTAVHLPLVLPPVVVGYFLLELLGRRGWLGSTLAELGIEVAFTPAAVVLSGAAMSLPLLVRAARLAIEAVDPGLEQAARTLGAGRWRTAARVTLPLALPGIAAGMILCFARALGEFGATIVFAGNIEGSTRTLPLLIFTELQVPGGEPRLGRLVLISVAVAFVALALSELGARRMKARRRAERAARSGGEGGAS